MLTSPRPETLPPVPPEVSAFAASEGAAQDLPAVLGLTRRLFPGAAMRVRLEEDSDVADSHVLVEVDVRGEDANRIALAQVEWADELFRECPSGNVWLFRLCLV